ncbi:helix-turn-helix domain-containing protein [Chryseobacterium populi]|uniref:DNA-binding domain-containing protein, AraC-type n=1 Tax=Chryseobacterium populi TaxID=1144316 RepID=J2KE53_9FLAO|nr:helix-turn-helix domain-containing protein [Chryseobacterium populi]EJL71448.1 DNA-binding domain-containing protein, AraC-type [Chryseobacterium populi]
MKKLFFILSFLSCLLVNAQDLAAYNKLYNKTYLETASKDFKKALYIADSLYKASETPTLQAKSLMLSANLYRDAKDFKRALLYAEKAETIIEKTDDLNWQARISLFLAGQYRGVELYSQSKKYAQKTLETGKMIKDTLIAHKIQGLILQEMAYYEMDQKKYRKSNQYIQQSQLHFNNVIKEKDFFTADNEQMLGSNYYHLKNIEASLFHYKKALNLVKDVPENEITGYIYSGLANVYLEKKDLLKAKEYLDLAKKVSSEKAENLELKKEVYNVEKQYYLQTENIEKLKVIDQRKDTLEKKIASKTLQFINESYTNLDKKIVKAENKSIQKNYLIVFVLVLLIIILILYIRSKIQQKENIEKFGKILEKANEKPKTENSISLSEDIVPVPQIENNAPSVMMASETEQKLLAKLKKFEKSNLYNNKNISLPYLAGHFETNTKYLSYVINTHKKKDFNNYINELRINYIVEKLKNDSQYRNYKMASLADEVGFSSHSKFTKVFKKETSLSPSLFIKYLQEEIVETKRIKV